MQCAEALRVQAYFDGETDAVLTAEIEQHLEHCAECRALLEEYERTRAAIRRELGSDRAPPELRAQVMRALDEEEARAVERAPRRSIWRASSFWIGALSGAGVSGIAAALLAFAIPASAPPSPLLDELVSAHVRSLMAEHLIDVRSTDQHTVKPWFAGHVDVSPVVADFAQQGYRLIGGRADYVAGHRSAVVVYQHGPHFINVFSWPEGQRALPGNATRNGYHLAFWRIGDVDYCAVSDTGWSELLALERLERNRGAAEER